MSTPMDGPPQRRAGATIAGVGEFGLIERIARRLRRPDRDVPVGIGDDTAVIDTGGPRLLLATVDMQVEGRHFLRGRTPPDLLGRRLGAVNLSDIASMGGRPRWALSSLALPGDLSTNWTDAFFDGLDAILGEFDAFIVGGNLSGGDQIAADLTLLGEVDRDHVLTRSGAHIGDIICVTGTLGRSAAGRAALDAGLDGATYEGAIRAHQAPVPRVREGQALAETMRVHAMMDISDGLASDLRHICDASGVGAVVDADRLPVADVTVRIGDVLDLDPIELAVAGGEDFELLLTVPANELQALSRELESRTGTALTAIGEITRELGEFRLVGAAGGSGAMRGWDHFRT